MLIDKQPDGSILLTAPVMIPNKPDCDFGRGEPPLTVEQIKRFKESYNQYQFVDHEHQLKRNGRIIGEPFDSYILSSDKSIEV